MPEAKNQVKPQSTFNITLKLVTHLREKFTPSHMFIKPQFVTYFIKFQLAHIEINNQQYIL